MMQKAADLQTMSNLVQTKQYGKALKMALRLGHPGQALSTITMLKGYGLTLINLFENFSTKIVHGNCYPFKESELNEVVAELGNVQKMKLMEFWNGI